MGEGRDAWDVWPGRSTAQQALSRADVSGTNTPSAPSRPSFTAAAHPAPSFGPMSHLADAGRSRTCSKSPCLLCEINDQVLSPEPPSIALKVFPYQWRRQGPYLLGYLLGYQKSWVHGRDSAKGMQAGFAQVEQCSPV